MRGGCCVTGDRKGLRHSELDLPTQSNVENGLREMD